jgi:hypothetical protein
MRIRPAVRDLDIHENNWSSAGETSSSRHRREFQLLGGVCRSACHLRLLSFRKYSLLYGLGQAYSSLQNQALV